MRGHNHVILMGYVGSKPSGRTFENSETTSFRLSTKDVYNDPNTGQRVEETEWHNIVGFGNFAKIANNHIEKGAVIIIHGSLKTRKWQDDKGMTCYKTEVVISQLDMLRHGEKEQFNNQYQENNQRFDNNNQRGSRSQHQYENGGRNPQPNNQYQKNNQRFNNNNQRGSRSQHQYENWGGDPQQNNNFRNQSTPSYSNQNNDDNRNSNMKYPNKKSYSR